MVLALRARQSRALLTTLLLSFGMPLLHGGDELGRTQRGNNNAYCQDNDVTWFDWSNVDTDLLAFTTGSSPFAEPTRSSAARRSSSAWTPRAAVVHAGRYVDDAGELGRSRRPMHQHLPRR